MRGELIGNIFAFLRELKSNNNREWFAAHKESYLQLKSGFEALTDELIARISKRLESQGLCVPHLPGCAFFTG